MEHDLYLRAMCPYAVKTTSQGKELLIKLDPTILIDGDAPKSPGSDQVLHRFDHNGYLRSYRNEQQPPKFYFQIT